MVKRNRLFQASARSTLVWAVVGLILSQGVLRLVIDRVYPELRDPTFEIKARRLNYALESRSDRPLTVLMTGSSVTSNAFKAKQIEEHLTSELQRDTVVFNMGCHGAASLTQLMWIRRLLDRGIRPDFIIVEFSPQFYDGDDKPADATRFPSHVLTRRDLATIRPYMPDNAEARQEWRWYRWIPAYFHRLTILNMAANTLVPIKDRVPIWTGLIDDRCWTALHPRPKEEVENNIRQITSIFGPRLKNLSPGRPSMQALEELLALVEREKIPAAMVMAPQSPAFRKLYPPDKLNPFVKDVQALCEKHCLSFVSAFDWLDEDHFTDCIHPTSIGAEIFSARLQREVLLPTLLKHKKGS